MTTPWTWRYSFNKWFCPLPFSSFKFLVFITYKDIEAILTLLRLLVFFLLLLIIIFILIFIFLSLLLLIFILIIFVIFLLLIIIIYIYVLSLILVLFLLTLRITSRLLFSIEIIHIYYIII